MRRPVQLSPTRRSIRPYLPNEHQPAKYSELGRARNMTTANIEIFCMLRTQMTDIRAPKVRATMSVF